MHTTRVSGVSAKLSTHPLSLHPLPNLHCSSSSVGLDAPRVCPAQGWKLAAAPSSLVPHRAGWSMVVQVTVQHQALQAATSGTLTGGGCVEQGGGALLCAHREGPADVSKRKS